MKLEMPPLTTPLVQTSYLQAAERAEREAQYFRFEATYNSDANQEYNSRIRHANLLRARVYVMRGGIPELM